MSKRFTMSNSGKPRLELESRNGRMADIVAFGDRDDAFASFPASEGFRALVPRKLRFSSKPHSVGHGARPTLAGSLADQFALELRETSEHGEHQAPMRVSRVGPCVAQRFEASAAFADCREDIE